MEPGCPFPCKSLDFVTKRVAGFHVSHSNGMEKQVWDKIGRNSSSILIITHVPTKQMRTKEEVPKYTAISFISDVGGIMGIFLGVSFLSIYEGFLKPIVHKFVKSMTK